MANLVVHFEIYVNDLKRAQKFYEAVLEWKFKYIESMNYTLVYPSGEIIDGPAKEGLMAG